MNLKIGGSNVGKIMYNGQEFGGATKLEPGTILYGYMRNNDSLDNVHLFSTTKNWNNLNGINLADYGQRFGIVWDNIDISGDDFKNLYIEKKYTVDGKRITVSRSIVDGEYRLNISGWSAGDIMIIRAI